GISGRWIICPGRDFLGSGAGDEILPRRLLEQVDEWVGVSRSSGHDHLSGFNIVDRDRDEVLSQGAASVAGGQNRDRLAVGDEFEFVFEGVDHVRSQWRWAAVRTRFKSPEAAPGADGAGAGGKGFVGEVIRADRFLSSEVVRGGDE